MAEALLGRKRRKSSFHGSTTANRCPFDRSSFYAKRRNASRLRWDRFRFTVQQKRKGSDELSDAVSLQFTFRFVQLVRFELELKISKINSSLFF